MPEGTIYRVTVFFKRKPGTTEEQFNHHWEKVHGPLVAPWAIKHGIIQYTQFFTPSHLRQKISSDVPSGASSLDYDAGVDWYVKDYEKYEAAYKDPYYINVIEPDEWNFVDKGTGKGSIAGAVSTLGTFRNIVEGGKSCVAEADLSEEQRKLLDG
ncbi:EthD domain-containing protein [Halenospora varia]|nr:EthD domain-containing protein [Halenospora varia]